MTLDMNQWGRGADEGDSQALGYGESGGSAGGGGAADDTGRVDVSRLSKHVARYMETAIAVSASRSLSSLSSANRNSTNDETSDKATNDKAGDRKTGHSKLLRSLRFEAQRTNAQPCSIYFSNTFYGILITLHWFPIFTAYF